LIGGTQLNLDNDPEYEWGAALSTSKPRLFLFDAESATWKISNLYSFSDPIQNLTIRAEDLPNGEGRNLILLATYAPSVPISNESKCLEKGASLVSELSIFQLNGISPVSVKVAILCDTPPDLSILSPPEILALIPKPVPPVMFPDDSIFLSNLTGYESSLLYKENIEATRNGLKELLAAVPPNHPIAPHLIPRILFDLGLSYELEGDAEAARTAYLDLIAQWPESPWAWLAEARISD